MSSANAARYPWSSVVGLVYAGAFQRLHVSFYDMVPDDVNLMINTKLWSPRMMHEGVFDRDAFDRNREMVFEAARETASFGSCEVVCIGGDLIMAAMGPAWVEQLQADLQEDVGVPTPVSVAATTDAFRYVGAQRIAIASPHGQAQTTHYVDYLTEAGLEVPAVSTMETATVRDVVSLDPGSALAAGRELLSQHDDIQALFLPCPLWRGVGDAIAPLEEEFGVTVVTMFSSLMWRSLWHMGRDHGLSGYGRLLDSPQRGGESAPALTAGV